MLLQSLKREFSYSLICVVTLVIILAGSKGVCACVWRFSFQFRMVEENSQVTAIDVTPSTGSDDFLLL